MNILVIGAGSIGSTLLRECEHIDRIRRCYVLDHHPEKLERLEDRYPKVVPVEDLDKTLKDTDLVVEAASQEAVKEFGPMALEAGADLMIMSVGALVDEELRSELYSYDGDIYLPTGALCGIDAVYNASMADVEEVTLETTKPPTSLGLTDIDKRKVLFHGPAEEAVKLYPKNVNVAAILSLASIGFKKTKIKLVCDPDIDRNTHKITLKGAAGTITGISENVPSPDNPRTSYLAALSAAGAIKKICSDVKFI